MTKDYQYPRIPEEQYRNALGHLRFEIGKALRPLRKYGQDPYVDGAIEAVVTLSEQFAMRVRGKEQPIILDVVLLPDD